jgi:hypothetical protein
MKHSAVTLLLPLLAACGGGVNSAGSLPQGVVQPLGSASAAHVSSEAESDALPGAQPPYTASAADLLYVANDGDNTITVYRHDASGNTAPLKTIAGSKTGISGPGQLSQDARGDLYVANGGYSTSGKIVDPSILVFAHGASGNVAPIRKIAGPLSGIHNPLAVTVDQATGKIFVVDNEYNDGSIQSDYTSILRFSPNATGATAPFARSQNNFLATAELASDSSGRYLIDPQGEAPFRASAAGTQFTAKQFANQSSPDVIRYIGPADVGGVADDPTTKTFVATLAPQSDRPRGIYRFAEDTIGNFAYDGDPEHFSPAIVSTITSDTCGTQIALGYLRNIYVTHSRKWGGCTGDAVYVYTHDASGHVPPLRILTGAATKLSDPSGIYEGQ